MKKAILFLVLLAGCKEGPLESVDTPHPQTVIEYWDYLAYSYSANDSIYFMYTGQLVVRGFTPVVGLKPLLRLFRSQAERDAGQPFQSSVGVICDSIDYTNFSFGQSILFGLRDSLYPDIPYFFYVKTPSIQIYGEPIWYLTSFYLFSKTSKDYYASGIQTYRRSAGQDYRGVRGNHPDSPEDKAIRPQLLQSIR